MLDYFRTLKKSAHEHLHNNAGSLYFEKIILVAAAFVVGSILITVFISIFSTSFRDNLANTLTQILTW